MEALLWFSAVSNAVIMRVEAFWCGFELWVRWSNKSVLCVKINLVYVYVYVTCWIHWTISSSSLILTKHLFLGFVIVVAQAGLQFWNYFIYFYRGVYNRPKSDMSSCMSDIICRTEVMISDRKTQAFVSDCPIENAMLCYAIFRPAFISLNRNLLSNFYQ